MTTVRHAKPALGFILVTVALDVLGFGLLIPIGPRLVESLVGQHGEPGTIREAAPYVGNLASTYYLMWFLLAPLWGVLSDKIGRRPVILLALFGSGLDFFAQALAPTITWLFVTRAINGMTGSSFGVASAYIADITPPEKRAGAFGLMGAAFGLGFVIGPALGGVLGDINIRLPFFVAGGLCLLNWLYGAFVLPESLPLDRRAPFNINRANPVGSFAYLTRYPLVFGLAVSLFMLNLAQFALHATWALSAEHRYGWSPLQIGMSLMVVGLGAAVVQGGLSRRLIPRLGERRSLLIGIAVGVLAYTGYGLATQGWMVYAIVAVASIGAIGQPASQALISKSVRPDEQGSVQGALSSLGSLAGIFGPMIGSQTFAYFISTDPPPFMQLPGASFFVSALLGLLGWFAALWAVKRSHALVEGHPPPVG